MPRPTLLTASRIPNQPDLRFVDVPVPEWPNPDGSPGIIRLRQLTAAASISLAWEVQHGNAEDGMYLLLVWSAIDEAGHPIFTVDDIPKLREKNIQAIDRLQRICLHLNVRTATVPSVTVGRDEPAVPESRPPVAVGRRSARPRCAGARKSPTSMNRRASAKRVERSAR